jgi:hypothetical protein
MKPTSVASLDDLELELRLLPGVINVGFASVDDDRSVEVIVVARQPESDLSATAERLARAYRTAATVEIVTIGEGVTAPAEPGPVEPAPAGGDRVRLVTARYNPDGPECEVTLVLHELSGVGRAADGPLTGTAAATLGALSSLGLTLPAQLVSVSTQSGVTNSPVRVILGEGDDAWVGIAQAGSEAESASRATLDAFNRFAGHKMAQPVS